MTTDLTLAAARADRDVLARRTDTVEALMPFTYQGAAVRAIVIEGAVVRGVRPVRDPRPGERVDGVAAAHAG